MASLKDIKKRIGTVKNTQQITKAMKMVSAAKLRRAQEAVVAARPYADKMADVLSSLALREDADSHPLLAERGKGKALIVGSVVVSTPTSPKPLNGLSVKKAKASRATSC